MDSPNANQRPNWHVTAVAETGSTNADLIEAGQAGAPDRTVLRADFQSAGRGRLDRTWEAPAGVNLLVSFLFRQVPAHPYSLTRTVALAALRVAEERCGVMVSLKWPNDVVIGTEKAGGILAQAGPFAGGTQPEFVVVGLGLNLGWAPPGATSLSANGWSVAVSPHEFCLAMLPHIDELTSLDDDELSVMYVAHVSTIGARVKVELPDGQVVVGRATSVESDGRLVVIDECAITHRFDTADIVHLRPDDR